MLGIFSFMIGIAFAIEITSYKAAIMGVLQNKTVAFSNLEDKGQVRCIVRHDGKSVGMKIQNIKGVGTIEIAIAEMVNYTTAT